jgi:peptidoglycan/xylan/chitin deacetylase (PgdA/CDA1 family)
LKVDVDTLRGTREGVPALCRLFKRLNCDATFLFALGPDHTGRAIRRIFRRGFFSKVRRTSVASHYGLRTLMYGTLLPGPDIGLLCADILRQVRDEGFETGIHCWDHVRWQDGVTGADMAWAKRELALAQERYTSIFKSPAKTHGAAGWQMSRHALRLTAEFGFDYCSDGRRPGGPAIAHYPVFEGEIVNTPQLPTTLPTLDEFIGLAGCDESNAHERLLALSAPPAGARHAAQHHVFTLHAELEGARLLPVLEKLIAGWREQGYEPTSLRKLYETLRAKPLPYYCVEQGTIQGRSGSLMITTEPFLAAS